MLPNVLLLISTTSHSLGIVASRATANSEDEVNLLLLGKLRTFENLVNSRVRHNAWLFDDSLAGCFEDGNNLVIDTILLDWTTAVCEHHLWTIVLKFITEFRERLLTEVESCRILEWEITLHNYIYNLLIYNLQFSGCKGTHIIYIWSYLNFGRYNHFLGFAILVMKKSSFAFVFLQMRICCYKIIHAIMSLSIVLASFL